MNESVCLCIHIYDMGVCVYTYENATTITIYSQKSNNNLLGINTNYIKIKTTICLLFFLFSLIIILNIALCKLRVK